MYLFVHLKADGSAHWTSTPNPHVPVNVLGPGDLGVVIHPLDIRVGDPQEESDANGTQVQ